VPPAPENGAPEMGIGYRAMEWKSKIATIKYYESLYGGAQLLDNVSFIVDEASFIEEQTKGKQS